MYKLQFKREPVSNKMVSVLRHKEALRKRCSGEARRRTRGGGEGLPLGVCLSV